MLTPILNDPVLLAQGLDGLPLGPPRVLEPILAVLRPGGRHALLGLQHREFLRGGHAPCRRGGLRGGHTPPRGPCRPEVAQARPPDRALADHACLPQVPPDARRLAECARDIRAASPEGP